MPDASIQPEIVERAQNFMKSYKSHLEARAKLLMNQQEQSQLPQLNKKLAKSRKKKLKIERPLTLQKTSVNQIIRIEDLKMD